MFEDNDENYEAYTKFIKSLTATPEYKVLHEKIEKNEAIKFGHVTLVFPTKKEAEELYCSHDDYLAHMDNVNRQLILHKDGEVTEETFLTHLKKSFHEWSNVEKALSAINFLKGMKRINDYNLLSVVPAEIKLIKTDGTDTFGAPYTRFNTIAIPGGMLGEYLFIHEMFHIISRHHKAKRPELYKVFGFSKAPHEVLTQEILEKNKKWTAIVLNPDALDQDYYLEVTWMGQKVKAVPFLGTNYVYGFSKLGFGQINKDYLLILKDDLSPLLDVDGEPVIVKRKKTSYMEQIGTDTDYVYHPEEACAEYFTLGMMNDKMSEEGKRKAHEIYKVLLGQDLLHKMMGKLENVLTGIKEMEKEVDEEVLEKAKAHINQLPDEMFGNEVATQSELANIVEVEVMDDELEDDEEDDNYDNGYYLHDEDDEKHLSDEKKVAISFAELEEIVELQRSMIHLEYDPMGKSNNFHKGKLQEKLCNELIYKIFRKKLELYEFGED